MKKINLLGDWNLSPKNTDIDNQSDACHNFFTDGKTIAISLPGDIHSALLSNGIIPDPYVGKNELAIQWVGRTDWKIERSIVIADDFMQGDQFVTLRQADTFVRVFVNKNEVGFCNNFFKQWRFNISKYLHVGVNTITLEFESSERHAIAANKKLPYPVPCSEWPIGSPNRNLVRKVQCHAGWDWGPCILAYGIYDVIQLESTAIGFVDYINCVTVPKVGNVQENQSAGNNWVANITATITALKDCTVAVSACIDLDNNLQNQKTENVHLVSGINTIQFALEVKNPEIWWPAGCKPEDDEAIATTGEALLTDNVLYNLTVVIEDDIDNAKVVKTAFRTLKTISEPDETGRSLYFEANGRSVFAKGSDWIPADALPSRITHKKIDYLLTSLIKSNQNCVRVWGGGMYESEDFYDLCDRKGIMVWQDCMFACSMYPDTKDFLDTVREEIQHQVKRLQHHASLVLWCGNNEDVGALSWYEETKKSPEKYLLAYDHLNEGVIGNTIRELDPERMFWPSSPCGGPNNFDDMWLADGMGDMHFWSVWHGKKSFDEYLSIKPRFVSEFGYQSFSSLEEVKSYAGSDQLNLTSPVMEFHQRSIGGNSIILENFSRYFRFPENFGAMLYLSQVQQALAIKTAIEYWRSLMPHCMGAIYWQLNDVWPVASWSSIEYSGKWKLLHYAVRHFNAPVAILPIIKEGKFSISVINESRRTLDANLKIHFYKFDGSELNCTMVPVSIAPDTVDSVYKASIASLEIKPEECFVYTELCSSFTVSNTTFLTSQKECTLEKPELKVAVNKLKNVTNAEQTFEISISAKNPSFYTMLETSIKGSFSDNMFTVLPGRSFTVIFTVGDLTGMTKIDTKTISAKELEESLTVMSLRDTYK